MSSITAFVRSLLPNLDKDMIVEDCRVALAQLEQNVIPTYKSCEKLFYNLKFNSEEAKILQADARLVLTDLKNRNLIAYISENLGKVAVSAQHALTLAENNFQSNILPEAITFRQTSVIRLTEITSFMSEYLLDLLDYVYIAETAAIGEDAGVSPFPPQKKKEIEERFSTFCQCFNVMTGRPNDIPKVVNEIPDVVITPTNESTMTHTVGIAKLDPLHIGYINAKLYPIYYIRMAVASYQAKKYQKAKELRRQLQYRILDLKHRQSGQNDPGLQKQILVTGERIDKLDYDIAKMEKDYA